jgi:hypothetical protein
LQWGNEATIDRVLYRSAKRRNGATATAAIDRLQWQWGKRTRAMAMALGQGHWGNSNCNDNGDGVWAEMCMFYFEDQ